MKRKAVSGIMLTLILISMLTLAFNIQLVRAEPTTWTVDDDGGADFTSIQDAINAASPGDTIFVYNGTYYEHPYVMNKDDLTIVGENKNNTIIDGSGFGAVLRVYYAENVAVRGFRVQNGGWGQYYYQGSGIYLGHSHIVTESCNISDNIVSNCRYGISLWHSIYTTIKGNTISDANQGISFDASRDNTVVGNVISNGVQVGNDPPYGIQAWGSIDNTIVGNVVTNISYTGIRLSYATGNVVTGNIVSNTSVGISASYEASSNTIIGNNVSKNEVGIEVWNSNYNTITLNEISNNNNGIWHDSSLGTTIHNNNITNNNWYGISLYWFSNYNTISGNNITNNEYGIQLYESSNNTFRNNDASNNKYNFGVHGSLLSHYIQDIDDSNTVNGKPIYYWVNKRDLAVPLDAGYVALANCTNITVKNLNLANNEQGVLLAFTTNSTITQNNITNNKYGIQLYESSNNTISGSNIANNGYGILLYLSSNNTISANNITNIWFGIYLYLSSNNTISENNIANNLYGIYLSWSSNNTIYHNNFLDNTSFQAYCYESTNVWDDGYPSGGNYWSDYAGVDADGDGIGDTPHGIDVNNQDRYPLMEPWSIPTMIKSLIRTVVFWNLHKGTENSLTSKLDDAVHLFDKGNENGAIHKLMDFINQVEALRDKGKLENWQADYLISEAQKIIDLINE